MLAVIGGSGFYAMDGVRALGEENVRTPFGEPSAPVAVLEVGGGGKALFLPRHGAGHRYLPSEINYRANIWALKSLGARQVVAVSAAGSLRAEIAPGEFVLPSQYFDNTKGIRARTFFGGGLIAHVSTAESSCAVLRGALADAAKDAGAKIHCEKTYACVEGPRLGTRAESFFLRDAAGADVVGMTNIPEAFLAREAQLCYATLAVVTDYDCWLDDPSQHVTTQKVIERFGTSIAKAKEIVGRVLASPPPPDENHRRALAEAVLTPPEMQSGEHRELLAVLQS